jgi:hypothetical protein
LERRGFVSAPWGLQPPQPKVIDLLVNALKVLPLHNPGLA